MGPLQTSGRKDFLLPLYALDGVNETPMQKGATLQMNTETRHMDNLAITFSLAQIFWLCTGLLAVIGLGKALASWNPYRKMKERLDAHDKQISETMKRLETLESLVEVSCKSLLAIVNHDITGNGIEGMKAVRDELQDTLINLRTKGE